MKRRDVLKAAVVVPLATALPTPAPPFHELAGLKKLGPFAMSFTVTNEDLGLTKVQLDMMQSIGRHVHKSIEDLLDEANR